MGENGLGASKRALQEASSGGHFARIRVGAALEDQHHPSTRRCGEQVRFRVEAACVAQAGRREGVKIRELSDTPDGENARYCREARKECEST
jgi:hypothetical protein